MAHKTSKSYFNLQKRLDDAVSGAPESNVLYEILKILFTEEEAELVSVLPLKFFTVEVAAKRWHKSEVETKKILDNLADKGILLDIKKAELQAYVLAPTMAGFFEFSLMRMGDRFDKKVLSKLFYQYINSEDKFIRQLFMQNPPLGRVYVQEDSVAPEDKSTVLNYEKATEVIKTASHITVGTCYCRHKMEHLGKACDHPQDVCLTFNGAAESLSKHKIARLISKDEAMEILDRCISRGLIQFGDNVQEKVNFICNCCGCCCEAILAYKKFGYRDGLSVTNFIAEIDPKKCSDCGLCVKQCQMEAIKLNRVDSNLCVGCGACVRVCPTGAIEMKKRDKKSFVPKDSFERLVLAAIDTGKLQNYIFDNYTLWTHTILRKLFGTILSLKPAKVILANKQLQSRFLKMIVRSQKDSLFDKLYNDGKKQDYSHPELD
jgi:NAD-dependent dihydropyrimidine dehydrogenase PreA subunit